VRTNEKEKRMLSIDQAKRQSRAQLEALDLAESLGERMPDGYELGQMIWNIIVVGGFDVGEVRDQLAQERQYEYETDLCEARAKIAALPARQKIEEGDARQELEALLALSEPQAA
jgi:hypothetical protein